MKDQQIDPRFIVKLLEQTTSLTIVSDFLQSKQLRYSAGSWEDMYVKRIEPALAENLLTIPELIELLRSVEEFGRQHIFLYSCNQEKAIELMERTRIEAILMRREMSDLLTFPKILDQPEIPTLVDVRWASANVDLTLTFKELEQRVSQKLGETSYEADAIVKKFVLVKTRAVNIIRFHRDGLLEVRLASHSGASYLPDVARFWKQVEEFLPRNDFRPISFAVAKERLFKDKKSLESKIRFSDSLLRNENGITLRAATGSIKTDLSQDTGATKSMEEFMLHDDAYCDGHNIWFKAVDGALSRETHVLVSGEHNEFAVTANCSQGDYEHVLRELRSLNS